VVSESSISMQRTFQVRYVIEGAKEIKQLSIPGFSNFIIEDNFDNPAPVSNQPIPEIYSRVIVLSPKRSGRFVIPGATAVIDGKPMQSNTLQVTVKQTGQPGNRLNPAIEDIDTEVESELLPGEDIGKKISKNLFLRVDASKTNCYVGEPVMVVYKMYSRLNANSQVVKRPSFTGFSVLEMVDSYDSRPDVEKLNGTLYYTNIIRKVQLFPLQEGNFLLDAAEIESDVKFLKVSEPYNKRNDLRKAFGSSGPLPTVYHYRTLLHSDPVNISVKPLPVTSQPSDFKGAVGQFSLAVHVPSTHIRKGELVKIQVVVSGKGNLSLLAPPVIQWPAGIDTAEPVVKESFNKYAFPLAGNKTFEYSFAATDTGRLEIPAIQLPYYDPAAKEYKTASADPLIVQVAAGSTKEKEDKNAEGNSISDTPAIPREMYWFALVVVLIVGWIVYQATFLRKKNTNPIQNTAEPIVKKPTAAELLQRASAALEQANQPAFYHEVQDTLWNVVADKCKVLPSALNKQNIAGQLSIRGISPAVIQNLVSVLDECEWTLYTPDQSLHDMKQLLDKAEDVLQQLLVD
jgi:BatD DUF11 like domain